eukprot:3574461-Rhodomonas_salina.6
MAPADGVDGFGLCSVPFGLCSGSSSSYCTPVPPRLSTRVHKRALTEQPRHRKHTRARNCFVLEPCLICNRFREKEKKKHHTLRQYRAARRPVAGPYLLARDLLPLLSDAEHVVPAPLLVSACSAALRSAAPIGGGISGGIGEGIGHKRGVSASRGIGGG